MTDCTQNSRIAARSPVLSVVELHQAANCVVQKRKGENWSLFGMDSRREPSDAVHSFEYFPAKVTSLRHFRVCHTNESIWNVSVNRRCKLHPDLIRETVRFFSEFSKDQIRRIGVTFYVNESGQPCNNVYGEFSIQLSMKREDDRGCFSVQVGQFAKTVTEERRISFLGRAITLLGLDEVLQIVPIGEAFRIDALPPWTVGISGANVARENPWLFYIGLPGGFDEVWLRFERLLSDPMIKRIDNASIGILVAPDQLDVLHEKLNNIASGWQVGFYGSYADGIDPYTAEASESPDGRFPIFTWMPERQGQGRFFQIDVVPTPSGRYLEIHSNCGSMQELLDEAEAATGVRFTPVDEPGNTEN